MTNQRKLLEEFIDTHVRYFGDTTKSVLVDKLEVIFNNELNNPERSVWIEDGDNGSGWFSPADAAHYKFLYTQLKNKV